VAVIKTSLELFEPTTITLKNSRSIYDCSSFQGGGGFMYIANEYIQVVLDFVEIADT